MSTKVNRTALNAAAKKLNKLRLTQSTGRKEHPALTVHSVLKAGLDGLYDDEAINYILRHGIKYYLQEIANDT